MASWDACTRSTPRRLSEAAHPRRGNTPGHKSMKPACQLPSPSAPETTNRWCANEARQCTEHVLAAPSSWHQDPGGHTRRQRPAELHLGFLRHGELLSRNKTDQNDHALTRGRCMQRTVKGWVSCVPSELQASRPGVPHQRPLRIGNTTPSEPPVLNVLY